MTRAFALLCSLLFLILSVAGLVIVIGATAAVVRSGQAQGNLGSLTLHLTWPREILDVVATAVFVYIALLASGPTGRIVMAVTAVVLLVLGITGAVVWPDNAVASGGFLGMHSPTAITVLDVVIGALGILSSLGPTADPQPKVRPSPIR
jgi:hypothetical protein